MELFTANSDLFTKLLTKYKEEGENVEDSEPSEISDFIAEMKTLAVTDPDEFAASIDANFERACNLCIKFYPESTNTVNRLREWIHTTTWIGCVRCMCALLGMYRDYIEAQDYNLFTKIQEDFDLDWDLRAIVEKDMKEDPETATLVWSSLAFIESQSALVGSLDDDMLETLFEEFKNMMPLIGSVFDGDLSGLPEDIQTLLM